MSENSKWARRYIVFDELNVEEIEPGVSKLGMELVNDIILENFGASTMLPSWFSNKWMCEQESPQDVKEVMINEEVKRFPVKLRGKFPTRVGQFIKLRTGESIRGDIAEAIGKIAAESSIGGIIVYDFTQELEWEPGDFADESSCFWMSKSDARIAMAHAGAFAMRFYSPDAHKRNVRTGIGRMWILPNAEDESFITFNAYMYDGWITKYHTDGYKLLFMSEIFSRYVDMDRSERTIDISNHGYTNGLVHINSGAGFYICNGPTPEHIDLQIDDGVRCHTCNKWIPSKGDDVFNVGYRFYCHRCYHENMVECPNCSGATMKGELRLLPEGDMRVCRRCYDSLTFFCKACGTVKMVHHKSRESGVVCCDSCVEQIKNGSKVICPTCKSIIDKDLVKTIYGRAGVKIGVGCNQCMHLITHHSVSRCNICAKYYIGSELTLYHTQGGHEYRCSQCDPREREQMASAWHEPDLPSGYSTWVAFNDENIDGLILGQDFEINWEEAE